MSFLWRVLLAGFFFSLFFYGCGGGSEVTVVWTNEKAVGLSIPSSLVTPGAPLRVKLWQADSSSSVLGTYRKEPGLVIFEPVVPLTRGFYYEVFLGDKILQAIEIPPSDAPAPEVLIYPTQDTVPENLLKMYLKFTQPMAEGKALSFLTLTKSNGDTVKGAFLDLQPELWNTDGTILTVWLDPGRIKKDLIPNKSLGSPLVKGEEYFLNILPGWKSKEGVEMWTTDTKFFVAGVRDASSPSPDSWLITAPQSATNQPLEIQCYESLDFSLLHDAIRVVDPRDSIVSGSVELDAEESIFRFIPDNPWTAGKYVLKIESRLEDLAGNNLNRLFDVDLKATGKSGEKKNFNRRFEVR